MVGCQVTNNGERQGNRNNVTSGDKYNRQTTGRKICNQREGKRGTPERENRIIRRGTISNGNKSPQRNVGNSVVVGTRRRDQTTVT